MMKRLILIGFMFALNCKAITIVMDEVRIESVNREQLSGLTLNSNQLVHVMDQPGTLAIGDGNTVGGFIITGSNGRQIIPTVTTNALLNGTALLSAYTTAQAMSPAESNEVTIVLPPQTYDLGASTLNMTSEYINIVGQVPVTMTMIGKVVTSAPVLTNMSAVLTGEEPKTIITSSGVTISNKVNNGSIYFVKVVGDVVTDGAKAAVWQDVWFAGNVDKELPTSNTFIRVYAPLGICGDPDVSYSGNNHFRGRAEQSVISGDGCVGGDGGTASGTFTGCTISGVYCVGGEYGNVSGTFSGCTISGTSCVGGYGTASGTFTDCTISGTSCVSGGGGTASGTFSGCTISGTSCVSGGGGTASGTFSGCTISGTYCVGGEYGNVSGTFTDCTISGDYCVGGNGGNASGINVFQTKITGPNQMSGATFSTNTLFSFSTGVPLEITNSVAKVFNCATETLTPIPDQD